MASRTRSRLLLLTFLFGALVDSSAGQEDVLYWFNGDSPGDGFGTSVSGAGDVNGDGVPDFIVGAPRGDNAGIDAGSARILSGANGSVVHTLDGYSSGDRFGTSVGGVGDVDGDGFDDVIVGADAADNPPGGHTGSAAVISGASGSVLYLVWGDSELDSFGHSVDGAGDVNGDGVPDFVVGAPGDDNNGFNSGSATVFSGESGTVLHTFNGGSSKAGFGNAVSSAGDVNADGYDDVIVGSWRGEKAGYQTGSAQVFSGKDGSVLHTFWGESPKDLFGSSVSYAGDLNADGFDDLIVGATFGDSPSGKDTGCAKVFSGKDGNVLYAFSGDAPYDQFGSSVHSAGDVNADGIPDVIVGAWAATSSARVQVLSGKEGALLASLEGEDPGDGFGVSVSAAGDVNLDGLGDLLVGAPTDDIDGTGAGSALVVSGCGSVGRNYCGPAQLNSTGQPAVIRACGTDVAGGNFLVVFAADLPANKFALFLNSQEPGLLFPPGSQGFLCLSGAIGRYSQSIQDTGSEGIAALHLDLTDTPTPNGPVMIQPGETWYFQAWFRDDNPNPTSNFTDGVSITFK